jgi:hypothetical protein
VAGDTLAQKECIRFAIRRNLPTVRQVWNNSLAAIQRIAPDQITVLVHSTAPQRHRPDAVAGAAVERFSRLNQAVTKAA